MRLGTMCERYVTPEPGDAEDEFGVVQRWWKFSPSFNVRPLRSVPVVREHDGRLEGVMLHWGLVPGWAEADSVRACATHVSAQALEHSTITRGAWESRRRCIVPMFGFYAWQLTAERYRQPFFVRLVNRPVFGVAALWDRSEAGHGDDVVESCTLITVAPNALLADLQSDTSEMPAILERRDYAIWLKGLPAAARLVLRACAPDRMVAHPVSPRINSLDYDDVQLIRAVDPSPRGGLSA